MGFEPSGEIVITAQANEEEGGLVYCGCQYGIAGWHKAPRCDKDPHDK